MLESQQVTLCGKSTVPAEVSALVQTAQGTAPVQVELAAFSRAELLAPATKVRSAVPVGSLGKCADVKDAAVELWLPADVCAAVGHCRVGVDRRPRDGGGGRGDRAGDGAGH